MKIFLNGEPQETQVKTLGELIAQQNLSGRLATAVNESFIAAAQRAEYILQDGDRIEILAPMQGG